MIDSRSALVALSFAWLCTPAITAPQEAPVLQLRTEEHPGARGRITEGWAEVWEDRAAKSGRRLRLRIRILHARSSDERPDPVYFLAGGPGQGAAEISEGFLEFWMRAERDLVFVDQRGTGRSNPLHVRVPGNDEDLQTWFEPIWRTEVFEPAIAELSERADLRLYTTPIAMDDLDEVRSRLGHAQVNLVGGSYGSRAGLVYLKQHPATVRCAIFVGVAPVSFVNPLYHAESAQLAFDALCAEVAGAKLYQGAYDDLPTRLQRILARLEHAPAEVEVRHPLHGEARQIRLDRDSFAEALRVLLYDVDSNRKLPRLLVEADQGDLRPFAQRALESNRALRQSLAFGMLMSVVGSEDLPRITEEAIVQHCAGTFLGDRRVRDQLRVGAIWPRGVIPADYAEPLRCDVPILLLSGSMDGVTSPRHAAEAVRHLSRGVHLVFPGCHGFPTQPAYQSYVEAFLARGSGAGLAVPDPAAHPMPPCER